MSNHKYQVGDKVVLSLDAYDKAFRPKLRDGMAGEIVEKDSFNADDGDNLYYVKIEDETYAVFESQLTRPEN